MKLSSIRGWLLTALILIALISYSAVDYVPKHSIYNEDDFGTSNLREELQSNMGLNVSRLLISPFGLVSNPEISLMVIIGSERDYTEAEVGAYRKFVSEGGSLIIFEDFGDAKSISKSMGITFIEGVLKESIPSLTINRPTQFFVKDVATQLLFGTQFPLYLIVSEAAAIFDVLGLLAGTTYPLLLTFNSAFLDVDDNDLMEDTDIQTEWGFPLGLMKQYNDGGLLIVISDASIPLNQYWRKKVAIENQLYEIANAIWTLLLISTIASYSNTTTIVFDESHQEIILTSTAGILNLGASLWVGLLNSRFFVFNLFLFIVIFGIIVNKDNFRRALGKFKRVEDIELSEHNHYISNPTLSERAISEQYILYNKMGDGFLHIANSELIGMIKLNSKSTIFLEKLEKKYGKFDEPKRFNELLKIHTELRDYVDTEIRKRL